MKAVATALVLIAGAAVVLWYGNTLNSWVLGGLIGGLAALLLSIPISLMLFSYISRRHDERLRIEAQEEVSLAQLYDYPDVPAGLEEYVDEEDENGYVLSDEEGNWCEDDYRLPELQSYPSPPLQRLPAPKRYTAAHDIPVNPYSTRMPPQSTTRQQARKLSMQDRKDTLERRKTTRRLQYPGPSSTEVNISRGQHQSAALRAARREAARQYDDEVFPAHYPKRPARARQKPSVQPDRTTARHSIQQEDERQTPQRYPRRPAQRDSYAGNRYQQYPPLGPVEQSMQTEQYLDDEYDTDIDSGNLRKPLLRRAPYMYEDDPLRQELSQHVNAPIVRRSTRLYKNEDE